MTKVGMSGGLVAAAVLLTGALGHARQVAPAAANDDVLAQLLVEVRGLRAAMEQMASAGPRVQLFASRLQMQETRMNNMIRRLDGVRDNLRQEQDELQRAQGVQKQFEDKIATSPQLAGRDELTQIVAQAKAEVAGHRAAVTRLAAEEAQLTQDLGVEQGRWIEINQRLDELERALSKK